MADEVQHLGLRLRDLNRSLRLLKQAHPAGIAGLPAGSVGMLMYIREHPTGCHGKALAARAGLDPSTVSRAVATLVDRGLVERQADPTDGRASVLALTAAGQETLAAAERGYGDVLDRALAGWTPAEVAALAASLGRFAADVERALTPHHPHRTDPLEVAR